MFGRVLVPPEVATELAHADAPSVTRGFIAAPPAWLAVQAPVVLLPLPGLDAGEVAAISLAVELGVPLLIDERDGRTAARTLGIAIIGAVGILEQAANAGHVADLAAVHAAIRALPFHVADVLLRYSLARHQAHRASKHHPPIP